MFKAIHPFGQRIHGYKVPRHVVDPKEWINFQYNISRI